MLSGKCNLEDARLTDRELVCAMSVTGPLATIVSSIISSAMGSSDESDGDGDALSFSLVSP